MLDFRAITPECCDIYNKYRQKDIINASEAAYLTLLMWNSYYNLEYAQNGEFFFLRFNIKGKAPSYMFPIGRGDLKKALDELSDYSHKRGEKVVFRLVTKENMQKIKMLYGERFCIEESRDTFDYVYFTEKMISLSGKKLHSKRNHLNYFIDNYKFEYVSVDTPELLFKCAQKAYKLVDAKTKNKNPYEKGAMESYFENYFSFNQRGGAILIGGEVCAMSFGQRLTDDTALIQIELADENYRGAYQAINKLFCENEWKECMYINREEDMGIEGLRHAKMSYNPAFYVEKYYIWEE